MWKDKTVLPSKEYDWGILVYFMTSEPKFLRVEDYNPNDPAGVEKWIYQKDICRLEKENDLYKTALEMALDGLNKCKTREHIGAVCRTPVLVDAKIEEIRRFLKNGEENEGC